ncbi:RHS repeat-associated protein [Actinoplanes tereljensis]|uniref:RHS repeat-associated protein n=1 Tax=Paractinoplanes tereljensis TaxID=571912 RepID=A0A919NT12_9ACTN|nr:DNRLRE domain-containing protein [Actinoplanes tereljensis]GIF23486.1 hypothetical protein Ate02nite_62160 [Actinoplanes tereljensis]
MGRTRGLLIAALTLSLVAGSAVVGVTRDDAAQPENTESLLDRVRGAAANLVGADPRPKVEPISAGLALSESMPAGRKWAAAKRVREVASRRTANGRVFALSDGRLQSEISAVPVNYRGADGKFRPIDTTVKATGRAGWVQGSSANSFTSLFGDTTGNLVRFEKDGRSIELGLGGAATVKPVVKGSTVTYPGLVGGADLVYEVSSTELKEKIVLKQAPKGPASYAFSLDTQGLTAVPQPDGSIVFRSAAGASVLTMPAPYMYDSAAGTSTKVTQTVSGSTVTVTADAAWLADPARKYPVVVDPTIRVQPVPTDAVETQISSAAATTNYGSGYQLKAGTDTAGIWRSLVKFDTGSIPAGTAIDDAQLQLYYDQSIAPSANDVPLEARPITAAWTEAGATWATTNSAYSATPAANTVTVDDGDSNTAASGTWTASTNTALIAKAVGNDYRVNNDAATGSTYSYVPTITEAGDYLVEVHYVGESDRAANAPYTVYFNGGSKAYTVDQTTPVADGAWKSLGVHPFVAGTTGKVVLGDVASKAVIADAVRFTKNGVVKQASKSSVWTSFPVRSAVQDWVNGAQPNNGLMVKAIDETLNRGGAIFEASEYAYNNDRRDANLPKLVVTYGKPGVTVNPPTTVTATGALLDWPAYTGTDIAEYQVHRSVYQTWTPSAATLVAPLPAGTTSYQDTTAEPTAAAETDPMKRKFFYYMVVVKTTDGQLIPGPTVPAMLPKAGNVTRIFRSGVTDTTLSAAQPAVNVDTYAGDPYVSPGNNSTVYGDTRGLVKFPVADIPANARVTDAQLRMWNVALYPGTDTDENVDVHTLTKAFDQTKATWNTSDGTTAWSTPGGDYNGTALSASNSFTNDPEWATWNVTAAAKNWVTTPAANFGLLLKQRDEVNQTARAMLLSAEAQEPLLRPTLEVTYLEQTPESTYYAPELPDGAPPATTFTTPVSVSNPTADTWTAADWQLSYAWTREDGEAVTGSTEVTALPADVPSGGTADLTATVTTPPSTTEGNLKTDYTISWELKNKTTGQTLSQLASIAPLSHHFPVVEPTSDQLGLENFYSYAGKNTGAGSSLMNNLYSGNTVWQYNAFANPGRGLSSFVRLAYNSLDSSDAVAGYGWSLQTSSMMRLGSPLDFHPSFSKAKRVTFTDGDGTSHWFTLDEKTGTWVSPKGVHLYLQQKAGVSCKRNAQEPRAWSLTRPDRTQFFYDCDGYLTATVDKNGNTMTFTYEERRCDNSPEKFLRYVTDPAGRQTITLDYFGKGDSYDYIDGDTWTRKSATRLSNPRIIDHVRSITDVSGRKLTFTYTEKGLLGELVDGAGSTNGASKTFKFQYDRTQGNKNVKLVKVTDPRGNATDVAYTYSAAGDDKNPEWRTKSYTDRLGGVTKFGYVKGGNAEATVTDAENHKSTYYHDGYGRAFQTVNAKGQVTKLGWDDDHNVVSLTEANGAVSTWKYDAKTGYPTEKKDAVAVANGTAGTVLTYFTQLGGYVAEVATKTSPEGRKYQVSYTTAGDIATVTDPSGAVTKTTYDTWGQPLTSTDPNGNLTGYSAYDANGFPQTITDALTNSTKYGYDIRGNTVKVTDPLGKATTLTYDVFGRPLEQKVPKDQANGVFITTPAPVYDTNDNITKDTAANGAVATAVYDAADQLKSATAPKDVESDPVSTESYTYDKVGNLLTTTEPKGNLTSTVGDYTTTVGYDEIYQQTSVVNALGQKISYAYDNVGNVVTVVDPRKNATSDTTDYTTKYAYDKAHRRISTTDALGKTSTSEFDRDGLVSAATDALGNTTRVTRDVRGNTVEMKVPYRNDSGTITYRTMRYEYDKAGNRTRMITPRGVATTDDPDDFAEVSVYDALNRVKETQSAYDKDDSRYNTPDKTLYTYDAAGRLTKSSSPPSNGQKVRNDADYTYFDNGWNKSSTDPLDITTTYDYDALGQQAARTVTAAGGSSSRTMGWSYYPDGKLKARTDDGVPVGNQVVLVDNADFSNTTATGDWPTGETATGKYGADYATHAAGTGTNAFSWQLNVPLDGTYEVFTRYPNVSGAATDATFTISHADGTATRTVNQTTGSGGWVSLGSYKFAEDNTHAVTLTDKAGGIVVADAVKLVRNNATDIDAEKRDYSYTYDANGNLTKIADASSAARADAYTVEYTGLNQVAKVVESKSGTTVNTSSFTYNENGAAVTTTHDKQFAKYEYDARDQLAKVTNGKSATDTTAKNTTFTYADDGARLKEVKGNGNTVDYTYFLDGLLKSQAEKKPNGTLVSESTLDYDLNGNRSREVAKKMNADNNAAYLSSSTDYNYDPQDRIAKVTKTGDHPATETYVHDANNNVIDQTVNGLQTTFRYDRNRLLTSTAGGATAKYNYDPYGRLDTVTSGGQVVERNTYDGFDHIVQNRRNDGSGTSTTKYTYDPMDRTSSKSTDVGTSKAKTTVFNYLGLGGDVLEEEVAGTVEKSYQYSPWGERLSQITYGDNGSTETDYYGYNAHSDVDQLTDQSGNTKATYGYTAYGRNADAEFTGIDKPDAADPTKEAYNVYRFNAKRWDQQAGTYDMGFRDYNPGLNRFQTRDSYNGALADMNLGLDPWTGNRYAFAGGNPINRVELNGHTDVPAPIIAGLVEAVLAAAAAAAVELAIVAGVTLALGGIGWMIWSIATDDGELSADDKADQAGIHGTEEGAEQAADLATELNDSRRPYLAKNSTTSVIKVWDSETNTYKIKVAVAQPDDAEATMPAGWEDKIRAVYGNEIEIEFVTNPKDSGQHAEETIIGSLGDTQVIVEGGANRAVCMYICNAELGNRVELGGQLLTRSRGTKFRSFYRLFTPNMSPPSSMPPPAPTVPNPQPGPVPNP